MPLGFAKTALLGAAGAGGGFEHWFGMFSSNATYYVSGVGNGLALNSSDNIGLVYQGNGSPDGSLASSTYPFNAVIDKTGILQWAKALAGTGGAVITPNYPVACGFKDTTNGKFYVEAGMPAGGQFGSNTPSFSTNQPSIYVDINDATGAINADHCVYEDSNSAQNLTPLACTETHTIGSTKYLYSAYKNNNPTGATDSAVGLFRQELNSSGGFTSTPTRYGKYIPSVGQNIYNAINQGCDFGINSGSARFASVGYAYYSGDGAARFIPYLLMFDEDGGNFTHASPYLSLIHI